jgi:carbonic anhydrase/SulP family sulfate permease
MGNSAFKDLTAGLVVFVVAVPLCLGIALSSNAPLLSGILAGIIGGLLVGAVSKSQTSVSGPAAALAAIISSQIGVLGSFKSVQLAVVIAGAIQIGLGLLEAGAVAAFFPSSVIKGLLAAIGVLLILKQIPHLLGHDADPEGDMSFHQPDNANTFSELFHMVDHIHFGASAIGIGSLVLLIIWGRSKRLQSLPIPAPLAIVVFGVITSGLFASLGSNWAVERTNFVQVPVAANLQGLYQFFQLPDFSAISNPSVFKAAITIALAASLGTLLNLESVDKLDRQQRTSPPSRELMAQGIGNIFSGMIGGLPMTSEIVRGSVNVNAGSQTKLSTIVHGALLLVSIVVFPRLLNMIPLSCLAAILLVTGAKLASFKLFKQMWNEGKYQFAPFILTVFAIVFTDVLVGVVIGLVISLGFILNSNLRRPIRRFREKHLGGEVLHIELANQVSFLNRAALSRVLDELPAGGHVLLGARPS